MDPINEQEQATQERTCKICNIAKPLTDYYLINQSKPMRRCKECMAKQRPPKKVLGFASLDDNTQLEIRKALSDRRNSTKKVAQMFKISAPTLYGWISRGQVRPLHELNEN